jgi:hypothetical protein
MIKNPLKSCFGGDGGVCSSMKTITLFLSVLLVGFVAFSPLYGQSLAKSPDHPSTWVVGASNIRQELRWDNARNMLVADVTYSTRDYADSIHPTHESEYTLAFPSVHLNPSSEVLTAGGVRVGTLTHGIFTSGVKLDPNAELNIHRHHGRIYAEIAPAPVDR